MNIFQRVYITMGRWLNLLPVKSGLSAAAAVRTWPPDDTRERYKILRAYYDNNDLYGKVATALESYVSAKFPLQSLRNPAHQVVEFYVANLWRGQLTDAFTIIADNPSITDPIEQVWRWSNWGTKKQKAARFLARDGDLFLKVAQSEDGRRVFFQEIDAIDVTDFEQDRRGNVTLIRLDIFQTAQKADGRTRGYWITELWEKAANDGQGRFRVWEHDKGSDASIDRLPPPLQDEVLVDAFGIDFVPFVRISFIDVGDERGRAAIEGALDRIDEVNRKATRLSKQLFRHNDVTWALESDTLDAAGRPLPPPQIEDEEEIVEVGGERFLKPPSGWHIQQMVPQLDYASALAIVQDDMVEMERDLPEMTYFRLRNQELSGRAIQLKLGEAIARAEEVQGNALDGLVRANKMALTIGQNAGLAGFEAEVVGTYEEGVFEHAIQSPDVITIPDAEKAETLATLVGSGIPVTAAMQLLAYPAEQIADVDAALAAERSRQEQQRAQATLQALRDLQAQQEAEPQQAETEAVA